MRLSVLIVIYLAGLCCASKATKEPEQQSGLSNDPSINNKTDGFRRKVIVNQVIHDIPVRVIVNGIRPTVLVRKVVRRTRTPTPTTQKLIKRRRRRKTSPVTTTTKRKTTFSTKKTTPTSKPTTRITVKLTTRPTNTSTTKTTTRPTTTRPSTQRTTTSTTESTTQRRTTTVTTPSATDYFDGFEDTTTATASTRTSQRTTTSITQSTTQRRSTTVTTPEALTTTMDNLDGLEDATTIEMTTSNPPSTSTASSVTTPAALIVQAPTTQSTSDQTSTTAVVYDYGLDYSYLEGFTDLLEESSTTVQPSPTTTSSTTPSTPQPTTTAQVDVATTDSDVNAKRASPLGSTTTEFLYPADYGLAAPSVGGETYDAWSLDDNPAEAGGGSNAGIDQGGPLNKESGGVDYNKEKGTPSEEDFRELGGAPNEVKNHEMNHGGPPKIQPADDRDEGHKAPQNKEHSNDVGSETKEKDKNVNSGESGYDMSSEKGPKDKKAKGKNDKDKQDKDKNDKDEKSKDKNNGDKKPKNKEKIVQVTEIKKVKTVTKIKGEKERENGKG